MEVPMLTPQQIKEIILKELPAILEADPEVHRYFLQLSRRHFADKTQTEDRFDRVLDELRRDREEQSRKWDEENQKWNAQNRKWDEQNRKWDEENQKWDAQNRKWDEENQKWNAQNRKWDEQNRKWEVNQQVINEMLADIQALARKHDTTIGALGARWGLHTEQAFRNALKGILEKFAGVEVLNITEYDDAGVVFGRPDQIELDIIIKNGILIIAEIKSSMSKPEMYIFERKVRFYEERHQRKASEMIVISPMVSPNAMPVAEKLGIRVYSSAEDVRL
jgi:hypothetical protein